MRYLSLPEALDLHRRIVEQSGGPAGVRDFGLLESALAQPRMTFGGRELYPTLADKAAALGFSLIKNHPFADGNKRIGHAAMEVFLVLNNSELDAPVEEQERVISQLASGEIGRENFAAWVRGHIVEKS
jgi:death-on-curing protein